MEVLRIVGITVLTSASVVGFFFWLLQRALEIRLTERETKLIENVKESIRRTAMVHDDAYVALTTLVNKLNRVVSVVSEIPTVLSVLDSDIDVAKLKPSWTMQAIIESMEREQESLVEIQERVPLFLPQPVTQASKLVSIKLSRIQAHVLARSIIEDRESVKEAIDSDIEDMRNAVEVLTIWAQREIGIENLGDK